MISVAGEQSIMELWAYELEEYLILPNAGAWASERPKN